MGCTETGYSTHGLYWDRIQYTWAVLRQDTVHMGCTETGYSSLVHMGCTETGYSSLVHMGCTETGYSSLVHMGCTETGYSSLVHMGCTETGYSSLVHMGCTGCLVAAWAEPNWREKNGNVIQRASHWSTMHWSRFFPPAEVVRIGCAWLPLKHMLQQVHVCFFQALATCQPTTLALSA